MTERWFFVPHLSAGAAELCGDEAHHLLNVLRLRAGDVITLFDGQGGCATATLLESETVARPAHGKRARRTRVVAVRVDEIRAAPVNARQLSLLVAGCKGPRLAWLIEKCTELGAIELLLTTFERSVVDVDDDHIDKLKRIALEACKQSRRARLPHIASAAPFAQRLEAVTSSTRLLVADPRPDNRPFGQYLAREQIDHAAVVIGPEGGLSNAEIDHLKARGAAFVTLGPHILRVETAAVAAAAIWCGYG